MSKNILISLRGTKTTDFLSQNLYKKIKVSKKPFILLSEKGQNMNKHFIYLSEEKNNLIITFRYSLKFLLKNYKILFKSIYLTFKNIFFLKLRGFEWLKNNLIIDNINIGDLFIDTYNRFHLNFIKRKINLYLITILFRSIFKTLKIKKIIFDKKINLIISHNSGYTNNNTLSVKIGLKHKIPTIQPIFNDYIFWTNDKIKYGYYNLRKDRFLKKKIKNYSLNKIEKYFKERYSKVNGGNYTYKLDLNDATSGDDNLETIIEKKKMYEKIVLIAPHAFSDASHETANDLIFLDYYEHLFETLKFISSNQKLNNILWIVRPHPASKRYNEEGIVEGIVKNLNKKNILLSPKISTAKILELSDVVITSRGTIGLEALCFGKNAIIAGSSVYSGYNFILHQKNKHSYFNILKKIKNLKKINKKQIILSKKLLYYLEFDSPNIEDMQKYNNTFAYKIDLIHNKIYKKNRIKYDLALQSKLKEDNIVV